MMSDHYSAMGLCRKHRCCSDLAVITATKSTPTAATARVTNPASSNHERLGISEVCTMMVPSMFQLLSVQPIRSWMSAEGHRATPASPLRTAPHVAGDNYHGPITGDTVIVGGRGNNYILGQGRSPSLSHIHHLDICRRPALKRCPRN